MVPGGEELAPEIKIDDFAKVDLRIARIVKAELVEGSDKLLRLFDFLIDRTLADRPPAEIEIANEVFSIGRDVDVPQDATVRVGEMGFARADRRFALIMNRYAWENETTHVRDSMSCPPRSNVAAGRSMTSVPS